MHISVSIQPSRWLACYVLSLHGLVLAALFTMTSGVLLQITAVILVLCSVFYNIWRYTTDLSGHWVSCICFRDQHWFLCTTTYEHKVQLQYATVWRWLLVLNFYSNREGRYYHVLLLPDSCGKEQLRHLRAMVRHLPVWQK